MECNGEGDPYKTQDGKEGNGTFRTHSLVRGATDQRDETPFGRDTGVRNESVASFRIVQKLVHITDQVGREGLIVFYSIKERFREDENLFVGVALHVYI